MKSTTYVPPSFCDDDPLLVGPISKLFVCPDEDDMFKLGNVPKNITELAGGEMVLSRFEETDKQWHLNSDNQVECIAFSFNTDILLTGLGLGNCVRLGSFITVENIQVMVGDCTIGPVIF
mmetsp:Transcript_23574/g.3894  ORF Transcript_23574/g.3894 Transcript_23574/m.3894 type:complete len:120 (-) Transcript_23574:900-1259(-)